MPTVAIASEFLEAYARIPRAQQKKVREFTEKFQANPKASSINYEKIHAVKEAAVKARVLLVLNARTDVYLLEVGPPEKRYDEALKRLTAFRDAGAECVFIPGIRDTETISRFVRDLQCPINILAGPGSFSIPDLEKLGVARVSLGSAPMRATLGLLQRMAAELRGAGTYHSLEGAPPHGKVNDLLS